MRTYTTTMDNDDILRYIFKLAAGHCFCACAVSHKWNEMYKDEFVCMHWPTTKIYLDAIKVNVTNLSMKTKFKLCVDYCGYGYYGNKGHFFDSAKNCHQNRSRCVALTNAGERCTRFAVRSTPMCTQHFRAKHIMRHMHWRNCQSLS